MNPIYIYQKLLKATRHSLAGWYATWQCEWAFRLEVILSIFIIPLAAYLARDIYQFTVLLAAWLLVLLVELLNSAIEALADRVTEQQHPLIKRCKDQASGAVLLAVCICVVLWLGVLL